VSFVIGNTIQYPSGYGTFIFFRSFCSNKDACEPNNNNNNNNMDTITTTTTTTTTTIGTSMDTTGTCTSDEFAAGIPFQRVSQRAQQRYRSAWSSIVQHPPPQEYIDLITSTNGKAILFALDHLCREDDHVTSVMHAAYLLGKIQQTSIQHVLHELNDDARLLILYALESYGNRDQCHESWYQEDDGTPYDEIYGDDDLRPEVVHSILTSLGTYYLGSSTATTKKKESAVGESYQEDQINLAP